MKFACHKSSILKEIVLALDFTSQRNTLSVVSNVYLETRNNTLYIRATDQKVGLKAQIPVETIEEGATTVFCDKFLGILRSLPEETIIFEEANEKLLIKVENKASINFELRTISVDKYPSLEETDNLDYFALSQKDLLAMIDQTIFAISDDETRHFMNGVYLERDSAGLIMVATDGKRLSFIQRKTEREIPPFKSIIIPTKFLSLLKKGGGPEGEVELSISDTIIYARMGHQVMYSALIKGQFPNYKRVIPASQNFECKIAVDAVNEALKRVSLLVENKAKRIYLDLESNLLTISSEESDFGQAKEVIPCEYGGEQIRLAMNYTFLVSPLRVMEGDYLNISFSDASRAVTVKPYPERDYFHIIMPMQKE